MHHHVISIILMAYVAILVQAILMHACGGAIGSTASAASARIGDVDDYCIGCFSLLRVKAQLDTWTTTASAASAGTYRHLCFSSSAMPWLWHGGRTSARGSGMSKVSNDDIPEEVIAAADHLKNQRIDLLTASTNPPPTSRKWTSHGVVEKRYWHIRNPEVQGEPMTWGVQYVVVTQDETIVLRHYWLNRWNQMRLSSEVIHAHPS